MIRLHDLKPNEGHHRRRTRVGRGNAAGQGLSAGKGTKGQGSRKRGTKRQYFEGGQLPLVRRLPFKRGFNNLFKIYYQEVGLARIAEHFAAGDLVNPETLQAKGLIKDTDKPVAILGGVETTLPFNCAAHRFSGPAKAALETAGGTARLLSMGASGARATIKPLRKALRVKQETR